MDNELPYCSNRNIFILIVHNTSLKPRNSKADGSGPGLTTEGILHTDGRALGKPVSFIDGGVEAVLKSAKHLYWKRGAT
jgi:hypothetical protein